MAIRRASKSSISTTSSGKRSNLIAGYSPAVDEMDLIERVTVGAGGVASVTFGTGNTIPQGYSRLQIRGVARDNRSNSGNGSYALLRFNGDTGANYTAHQVYGSGAGAGPPYGATGQTYIEFPRFPDSGVTTQIHGAFIVDILDYTNTSKTKVARAIAGWDKNGGGDLYMWSGMWTSTNAITLVTILDGGGTLFSQYSTFSLYGVKA